MLSISFLNYTYSPSSSSSVSHTFGRSSSITVLYPRHVAPGPNRERTINLIHTLRNYLHYHIKCSKAYLHMRMRAKTVEFLKVLNRAHRDTATTSIITVGETSTVTDATKSDSAATRYVVALVFKGNHRRLFVCVILFVPSCSMQWTSKTDDMLAFGSAPRN